MLQTYEQHNRTKLITTVVFILVVAGIVLVADHLKSRTPTAAVATSSDMATTSPAQSTAPTSQGTTPTTSTAATSSAANGSYSAASDYFVPSGEESIAVNLTLKNGVITDASIQNSENDRDSAVFQKSFASEYKSYVVGKKISGLQLSNIAGASDTTQGFNDALSQIRAKAQA